MIEIDKDTGGYASDENECKMRPRNNTATIQKLKSYRITWWQAQPATSRL